MKDLVHEQCIVLNMSMLAKHLGLYLELRITEVTIVKTGATMQLRQVELSSTEPHQHTHPRSPHTQHTIK
jgi:hypothetical protein